MADLASYAVCDLNSRGRLVHENLPEGRSEFQRDRDRVIHSTAFRRLEYKTQVFVNHEGDLFRTRLTHSIEVAQIARSIARALHLNEDLAEAIALAHDLGHTPFGHAGQHALNDCMKDFGGFEHNLQSLRVVDLLEERYAEFDGLNLCFETREGILKHCSQDKAVELGDIASRFLNDRRPVLEAQVVNLADEIAYNNHDLDDGLRSGLITIEQLSTIPFFSSQLSAVQKCYSNLSGRRLIHETIRRMINAMVSDLISTTNQNIESYAIEDLEKVRVSPPLVAFGSEMQELNRELKNFLHKNLYRHYHVMRMSAKAVRIINNLFGAFMDDPRLLPPQYQASGSALAQSISDYIAGMTDRYAIREYRRIFSIDEVVI